MDETKHVTEKVYCYDHPSAYQHDNSWLAAAMCNRGGGYDAAMLANQWQNNPFAYMMILGMMRFMYGDNWQNGGNAEINSRFNQLSNQMADNHNTDILNEAIKGNTARLGELANSLNVDLRTIQTGICDVRAGIQQVAGETKFSAERVINAVNMGDMNIITALKDCCCQSKELIQRMGYENQLGQRDMTAALQQSHNQLGFNMQQGFDRTNTGLERGFSAVAYESQKQTCDIISAVNAAQQRTADLLNSHWKDEMSQALQDEKFKNSQLQQNIYMRDLIEKNNGCGCGC